MSSCCLVTLPKYLIKHFTVNNQVHSKNTGYAKSNLLWPKYIRETEGGKSFLIRACKLGNKLSLELRCNDSLYLRRVYLMYFSRNSFV